MTALTLTENMKKEIVEKTSALIVRANTPKALLSSLDISALTGFPYNGSTFQSMVKDPTFPRPVMVGSREKRWFCEDVFRWLERRHREKLV